MTELKLYTAEQVAKILQMNLVVVRRKLRSGEIKGKKTGKLWRVSEQALKNYLNTE